MITQRTDRDGRAIRAAARALDLFVHDVQPVLLGRTGIYRVVLEAERPRDGFPGGTSVQAARVDANPDSLTPPGEMHRLIHALREAGAPVSAPRHPDVVTTACGQVGFWEWMDRSLVTPSQWGRLTGTFHRVAAPFHHPRDYHPARVFESRLRRVAELTSQPGHPLFGARALVRSFESALDAAVAHALRAAASSEATLVHGDNQPANVMRAAGTLVLNDFERIATGPPALDLAAVTLGIQHYGYPMRVAEEFREGYGSGAPLLESARPYARIRELSGAVVAMIHAGDSAQMEREMHIRAACITRPGEGARWTYVGRTEGIGLAGIHLRDASTDTVTTRRVSGHLPQEPGSSPSVPEALTTLAFNESDTRGGETA